MANRIAVLLFAIGMLNLAQSPKVAAGEIDSGLTCSGNLLLDSAEPYAEENGVETRAIACCKVCTTGQACGDSCISWDKTCHKGPGCACQGFSAPISSNPL